MSLTSTNAYRALRELLPDAPLQVVSVVAINFGRGYSVVEWPGGGNSNVRGTSVSVGERAFVRDGVIEGQAPALALEIIEV